MSIALQMQRGTAYALVWYNRQEFNLCFGHMKETWMPALRARLTALEILVGMALALAIFHFGGALLPALGGLALFGALALLRPDLALLTVPVTAPLYLIPTSIGGLRAQGFMLPLHEAALLVTAGATAARFVWDLARGNTRVLRPDFSRPAREFAPHALFLLAGVLGMALAVARGPALIEFRRLIIEPLVFYALARHQLRAARVSSDNTPPLLAALVLAGALVSVLALLQYAGLDLVPYFGQKQCFAPDGGPCSNIVVDGGLRRAQSVYGHPNNLGLFLGRVWPFAAVLMLAAWPRRNTPKFWLWLLGALLCLGGLLVSFSRGAWLGALAAAAVLGFGLLGTRLRGRSRVSALGTVLGVIIAAVVLGGLALSLRGDVRGGSTPVRLLLWEEALGYIRLHPLGIGLDQFGTYHDPKSGLSLIDPALIGSSEQFAAHPHNLLLDIWLRLGPLGLVAFGWLLWRFFRSAMGPERTPLLLGALAAMVAALAHGLVDNFYFVSDLAIVFWLLIALGESDRA